jgi:MFS family permease
MAQWSSSYIEQSLGLPKIWGDICGVAFFSLMLGLGRSMYAKSGKNLERFLFVGAIGAGFCYLTATFVNVPIVGLIACGLTGYCVSMMWPGSLVIASDRVKDSGVFIYALMAAGGDLGASVGPQLIGAVTDAVAVNPTMINFAQSFGLTATEIGMKAGMAVASIFPIIAIFVFLHIYRTRKKPTLSENLNQIK